MSKASFALERDVDVDPAQMPYLTWRWKVTQLPAGGDFRHSATDDQAAQVLVAFADRRVSPISGTAPRPKAPWKPPAPSRWCTSSRWFANPAPAEANRWIAESRNVAADYERAFGKPAPRVKGLRIQINSQHTGTVAESYFGEVAFRSTPQ